MNAIETPFHKYEHTHMNVQSQTYDAQIHTYVHKHMTYDTPTHTYHQRFTHLHQLCSKTTIFSALHFLTHLVFNPARTKEAPRYKYKCATSHNCKNHEFFASQHMELPHTWEFSATHSYLCALICATWRFHRAHMCETVFPPSAIQTLTHLEFNPT